MREVKLQHIYKEPWHLVIQAYQQRFQHLPHPKIPALIEAVFETFNWHEDSQELSWVVLGKIDVPIASWIRRITGCSHCIFRTLNTLNYNTRTLQIHVTNDDYRQIAVVEEFNCFRVHPANDQWTYYEQESRLTIRSLLGMQSQVEAIVMRSYSENYEAGRAVDDEFIAKLLTLQHLPKRGFLEEMAVDKIQDGAAVIPLTHHAHRITTISTPAPDISQYATVPKQRITPSDMGKADLDLIETGLDVSSSPDDSQDSHANRTGSTTFDIPIVVEKYT